MKMRAPDAWLKEIDDLLQSSRSLSRRIKALSAALKREMKRLDDRYGELEAKPFCFDEDRSADRRLLRRNEDELQTVMHAQRHMPYVDNGVARCLRNVRGDLLVLQTLRKKRPLRPCRHSWERDDGDTEGGVTYDCVYCNAWRRSKPRRFSVPKKEG